MSITRPLAVLLIALLTLAGTLYGVAKLWAQLGVHMTFHGWVAYGLGAIGSLALAGLLFWLTFKSAREGYDDIERREDLNE